jgi:hypothetical protein
MNGLSLHPDKTKYMLISNSQTVHDSLVSIFLNNNNPGQNLPNLIHEIKRVGISDKVPAIKYLGVYFDPSLTFKYHLQQINSKISKALYHLRCAKNILPLSALKTLYFSLVHSHLTYAIEIWGLATHSLINDLYIKQKAAIRIITNSKYNSHTAPLFKSLNILPLPLLINYSYINIMHRHHFRKLPAGLLDTWSTIRNRINETGALNLRHEENYITPFARTDHLSRFPLTLCPKLWNNLPNPLKNICNINSFNDNLKDHLLENLNTICSRLFCPACSAEN